MGNQRSKSCRYVPVKFTEEEFQMLEHCCRPRCDSAGHGKVNRSELIRLLVLREYKRRTTGKSVVTNKEFSSEWRAGRMRKEKVTA